MTSSVSSSTGTYTKLWISILEHIEKEMQRTEFITWYRNTNIIGCENGTLVIGIPLATTLDRHIEKYQSITLKSAQAVDTTIEKVIYTLDGSLQDHPERTVDLLAHFPEQKKRKLPRKPEVRVAEGITSKILHPRYSLDTFVVGTKNRLAHAAAMSVSEQPGGKYNPLFIYGGVGLGKTHLLQGIGNAILQNNPRATVVYTTSEDFTNQVVDAIRMQKMDQVRKKYRQVDVLIVDDIQFFASKERCQEEFFHTFNTLYEGSKQLVISSDRPPEELHLEDRLTSRFTRGMVADVSEPDYETRLAILQQKASEHELFIDLPVLQFIAEHTTKNVRELEGILMQAVAQYDLENRVPTIKSIAEIMRKLNKDPHLPDDAVGFDTTPKKRATMRDVIEAVSRYYSVSIDDMVGKSRVREVLIPRQVAMFIGKEHLSMSFQQLGQLFGNRDHTTVMNACDKIAKCSHSDANILREIHTLTSELGLR